MMKKCFISVIEYTGKVRIELKQSQLRLVSVSFTPM